MAVLKVGLKVAVMGTQLVDLRVDQMAGSSAVHWAAMMAGNLAAQWVLQWAVMMAD